LPTDVKNRPPMPVRDRGGMFTINNPDDGTPIKEVFKLHDELLLLITEKCTYGLQVADQIDPERTNPNLAQNFQQKLFDRGTASELLCRTLLHAKVMFRKEFQAINVEQAMQLSFDAFSDLVALEDAAKAFKAAEQAEIDRVQALEQKDRSLTLPAVGNVRAHCKGFMQKADHFDGALLNIARLFYPELKGDWAQFHELIKGRYGVDENFYKVSEIVTPLLLLVRNARNCLEHSGIAHGVKTAEFKPLADGSMIPPSIEIDFRGSKQELCSISWLMEQVILRLIDAVEMITVHLCAKNIQVFAGFPMIIQPIPEQYKEGWHVRFAYGNYYQDGQFAPVG
jgi:hypothetical protein